MSRLTQALCLKAQSQCTTAHRNAVPQFRPGYGRDEQSYMQGAKWPYSNLLTGESYFVVPNRVSYTVWKARKIVDQRSAI